MKRGSLGLLLLLLIILSCVNFVFADSNSLDATEWRMYGRYLNNTRYTTSSAPENISAATIITKTAADNVYASPAVVDGYVYVTDYDTLYKLDAANISIVDDSRSITYGSTASSPLIVGESVYFSYNTVIYQYNKSDFTHLIGSETRTRTSTGIIEYNGAIYSGGWNDRNVYQLNSTDIDNAINVYYNPYRCSNFPAIYEDKLFLQCNQYTYVLNASDVTQVLQSKYISSALFAGQAVMIAEGSVYLAYDDDTIYQMNVSNISHQISSFTASAAFDGGMGYRAGFIYAGNRNDRIYQLNASNISIQYANYTAGGDVTSAPALTDQYLFIGSSDEYLYQLNVSNVSKLINRYFTDAAVYAAPVVADGAVYVGTGYPYKFYQFGIPNIPSINTNSPTDNFAAAAPPVDVNFSCTATDDSGLSNISFFLSDENTENLALNQTTLLSGTSNTTTWVVTLNDGVYSWTCQAGDNENNTKLGSTKTVNVDSDLPTYTMNSPDADWVNDSWDPINVVFNCSSTDNVGLSNISLYLTDSTNSSFAVNQTTTVSGTSGSAEWELDLPKGNYTWACFTTDSVNNINRSVNRSITANYSDTVVPTFSDIANMTIIQGNNVSLDINATDDFSFACFSVNDTTNFQIDCDGSLSNKTYLDTTLYNLNITINDTYGNQVSDLMWVNITPRPQIGFSLVTPTGNINVTQNTTFTVTVEVTCLNADCGEINVSLDPKPIGEEEEETASILSSLSLTDTKSFVYDIQDGCDISDGHADVFDGGLRLYIDNSEYTGTRSSTEESGREAVCNGQTKSSLNVSRKVFVPSDQNWARYLDILENPTDSEICVDVKVYQNMGSDGSDFMNTSDGDTTWETTDHWMMWDDSSASAGDDAAGFIYQQDGSTEVIDSLTPSTASGGYNQWIWEEVCIGAGQTEILMYFFTQWDTRAQSIAEADVIYTNYNNDVHKEGMSDLEVSQIVNWQMSGVSKSGLISTTVGDTPFYTTNINPSNVTLNVGESATISWVVNATGDANVTHVFFAFANKTADMTVSNITGLWNVSVVNVTVGDLTAPVITIESPSNNTFTTDTNIFVNYSAVEAVNISSCWYSNGTMEVNYTLDNCANITDVTWSEGEHTVNIWVNDTSDNLDNSRVTFTIDTIYPTINISSPENNSLSGNSTTNIIYSVSDTNLDSCWYSNDSLGVNYTITSCANISDVTWIEGNRNVTVWVNDSAGNENKSSIIFSIDITKPSINISIPVNNSNTTNQNLDVIYSVSDLNLDSCWYSNDTMSVNYSLESCANITNLIWNVGNHNLTVWVNDTVNNVNSSLIVFEILADLDNDGFLDDIDPLRYNETNVTKSGITLLNITVGGNRTNETYSGSHVVKFYDENTLMINFSHNFSSNNLDLSKVTIDKTDTSLIVNLSGQLQGNKTLFINDNNFASLCVKDGEVSSISEVSSGCNEANETDLTNCLGGSLSSNGIECVDEGNIIKISNLMYSAIRGTQASSDSSSSSTSGGGGSSSFISLSQTCSLESDCEDNEICLDEKCVQVDCKLDEDCREKQYCFGNECYDYECYSNTDCNLEEGESCRENICVKLFDIVIESFNSSVNVGDFFHFTYFLKGMADISDDVEIEFWISDNGTILSEGKDTIYVGSFEEITNEGELLLPTTLESGVYLFYIKVRYLDYSADSYRTIEIDVKDDGTVEIIEVEEKEDSSVLGFVVLGFLLMLVVFFYKLNDSRDTLYEELERQKILIKKLRKERFKKKELKKKKKKKKKIKGAIISKKEMLKDSTKIKTDEGRLLIKGLLKKVLEKKNNDKK